MTTQIALGSASNGAGPASVTLTATPDAGDGLIIAVAASSANTASIVPSLAGCTLLNPTNNHQDNASSRGWLWFFAKIADGTETSLSLSWTGGNMSPGWRAANVGAVDQASWPPALSTIDAWQSSADNPLSTPTRTALVDGEIQVSAVGGRATSAGLFPSWDSNDTDLSTAVTNGIGAVHIATRVLAHAGATASPTCSVTDTQGAPAVLMGTLSVAPASGGSGGTTDESAYTAQQDFSVDASAGAGTAIGTTDTVIGAGVGISCEPVGSNRSRRLVCGARVKITTAGAGRITLKVYDTTGGGAGVLVGENDVSGSFLTGTGSQYVTIHDRSFDVGLNVGTKTYVLEAIVVRDASSSLAATVTPSTSTEKIGAFLRAEAV